MSKFILLVFFFSTLAISSEPVVPKWLDEQLPVFNKFISEEMVKNAQGQNVHAFNKKLAGQAGFVRKANETLGFHSDLSWQDILDRIDFYRGLYDYDKSFLTEISKLRGYFQQGLDHDNETSMKASELLASTWGYMDSLDDGGRDIALSEFLYYLQQNTKERGGCFSGYVGRLMLMNGIFINREIESRKAFSM